MGFCPCLLGSLRYHEGDGGENLTKKVNSCSFNLHCDQSNSPTLSNVLERSSSLVLSSIKRKTKQFHVVYIPVVTAEKCAKTCDASAKFFPLTNLLLFCRSR